MNALRSILTLLVLVAASGATRADDQVIDVGRGVDPGWVPARIAPA